MIDTKLILNTALGVAAGMLLMKLIDIALAKVPFLNNFTEQISE